MKKTLLFTLAAAGGGTSARWHTPEGGGFGSLEPFLVEPAGGFAHTMSKPQGGGLDAENHSVEGRNPVLSIVNDV